MLAYLVFPRWLSPVIIPGLPLRWYGLMYLVAFGGAYLLFKVQVRERTLAVKDEVIANFFFWIIIGLLVGARILATTVYDPTGRYLRRPWLIFWPFDDDMRFIGLAGMSYHGGLIGTVVAAVIYTRVKKLDTLAWGDMLVTAVPLGYTFGRLGNFINGELYGRVTTLPIGVVFPHAQRFPADAEWVRRTAEAAGMEIAAGQTLANLPRHASQLYEAFFEGIVLWLLLWFVFRKRRMASGARIAIYTIGYGIVRFFIEYVREPDADIGFPIRFVDIENPTYLLLTPFNFTTGQILCFLMVVAGAVMLLALRSRGRAAGAPAPAAKKMSSRKLRKRIK